jgi:hypothetical protein
VGACPEGARAKPEWAGLQVWVDRSQLAADILSVIQRLAKLSYVSLAAELLDLDTLCGSNPDPVQPITAEDVVAQTFAFPTAGIIGHQAVIEKAISWLRYQQFLISCECLPPTPPSGGMCPYSGATVNLASGATSAAVTYDIPQSSYAAWPVSDLGANPDWKPVYQISFASHSPATTQRFLEWSSDQVAWHPFAELLNTSTANVACQALPTFIAPPRMPRTGFVRLHNQAAVSLSVSGLNFCFCTLAATPPPIPPQPPLTPVPTPPAHVCDDQSICDAINELSHRITIIAKQLAEVQRYGIPFGYIQGLVHPDRELSGSFPISRLLGMQVDVTAHVPSRPDLEGNPPYVWDQGWMSIQTGDGLIQEKRISQSRMVWLPHLMDLAVTFGFELRPGTVATFTELLPEP